MVIMLFVVADMMFEGTRLWPSERRAPADIGLRAWRGQRRRRYDLVADHGGWRTATVGQGSCGVMMCRRGGVFVG
ncbi:pollen-specific leucine-rich repeat extensin-like protein 3 [Iris pallida]|uniref:Pollen-specific leucine-rich repeat extensin-like protein 3 n=1 Tax=Iris pallida TaxID=29817 RepID=A0AAX6EYW0_IRIPA|nr:pollen-specific leucine-rich repeat extensin-like protein 3 [Iris pallida]